MGHGASDGPEREPALESPFLERDSPVRRDQRHLPHWRLDGAFCFVTWRMRDSLPQEKLAAWYDERRAWLREHPKPWSRALQAEYRDRFPKRLEQWLDAGYGACFLREPECAQIVAEALHFFDGERYNLAAFVIMPNHLHVLLQLHGDWPLERVTHSIKGFTAKEINRLLGRRGALWQHESFDHLVRGVSQLGRCLAYIRQNPDSARLKPGSFIHYQALGFDEIA